MAIWLKQSTAVVISFGPFVDKTDGVTLETGLVSALDHASTGILLSKNGGTLTVRSAAVTASTYDAYGNYKVTLSTTDTGTLGTLRVQFAETATCLPVWQDFMVVPANVWDSMFGADLLDVSVVQLGGVAQSLLDLKDFADDGYDPVTNKVQGVVLVDTLTTYTGNTPQTGDVFPLASTEIADIKAKTDNLPTDPADQSLIIAATDAVMARLGAPAGLSVSADIAAVKVDTAAIKLKTDALPADPADASDIAGSFATVNTKLDTIDDFLDTEVAAIKAKTDQFTFTTANKVDATIQAAADFAQAAADKVFGASGAALPELTQTIPPATPTPREAVMLPYMALRDKLTTDATSKKIHNDAGTVICKKTLSDDGTTYTEAEMVAGP